MENIKIIKNCNFKKGDVVNLGKERNERAVRLELAEWTDEEISTVEVLESQTVKEEDLDFSIAPVVETVKVNKNGAPKNTEKK